MRIFYGIPAVAALLAASACAAESTAPTPKPSSDHCQYVTTPFAGSANAPRITSVVLEVQSSVIVAAATATDPQGTANVRDVQQSFSVYRNAGCDGTPILLRDDLAESGQEETFGTAVDKSLDPVLYSQIAGASFWPVLLEFVDRDGNRTAAQFRAVVVR